MSEIPNTEYITINKDGVFVGSKHATRYRGSLICNVCSIKENFRNIQHQNPEIQELHVGAFETKGEHAQPGNPSGKFGSNAWCRVKLFNGRIGAWVFDHTYSSASACAGRCAYYCGYHVRPYSAMRSGLLNFTKAEPKRDVPVSDLKQALEKGDLSNLVGKKVELNGYIVTVQKQR